MTRKKTGAKHRKAKVDSKNNVVTRGLLQKRHITSADNRKDEISCLLKTLEAIPSEVDGMEEHKNLFMAALGLISKSVGQKAVHNVKISDRAVRAKEVKVSPVISKQIRKLERAAAKKSQKVLKALYSKPLPSAPLNNINDDVVDVEVVDLVSSDDEASSQDCTERIEIPVDPYMISEVADIYRFINNRKLQKQPPFPFIATGFPDLKFTGETFDLCPWSKKYK